MKSSVVASRYSSALFQICESNESRTKALTELKLFLGVLVSSPEVEKFFLNPVVSNSEKIAILDSVKDKFPNTLRFLITLIEAGRIDTFPEVVQDFERRKEAESGELSVDLTTAHPLTQTTLDEIVQFLQNQWKRQIKVKAHVNSEILGGFVARAPGRLVDASVANQLEALEQNVLAG